MAEAQHDMQDALNALRLWRAQIEAHTAYAQQAIEGIGAQARAHAYGIAEQGQTIGPPGQQLSTGGASDWVAPKIHPVWAPEVAHEARTLERMGSATFEYEPQLRTLEAWRAAGRLEIAPDWQAGQHEALETPLTRYQAQSDPFDWPTQAEQQAYEDRPYDLMAARAHGADERETGLEGQVQRLQDRLEALAQPEPPQNHHREEGMSYSVP